MMARPRYDPCICFQELREPWKSAVSLARIRAKIRTTDLPNASLVPYRYHSVVCGVSYGHFLSRIKLTQQSNSLIFCDTWIVRNQSNEIGSQKFSTPLPAFDPCDLFSVLMFCKTMLNVTQFMSLTSVTFILLLLSKPITVAARSKTLTVFVCWNTGIVGSNPTRGRISVCVYYVFVQFYL
jgi:hypothetical protein